MKDRMQKMGRRRGFTLVQLVVALGLTSMLATLLFNVFSDGRASARRAQCDAKLKTIALALDAHRQELGAFPPGLQVLRDKHFLHDEDDLHCPNDVRADGSYGDFYVIRASRDDSDLPTVVCPFHENLGGMGAQAFKGNYTKQFMTRPATLVQASGATIERPGQAPVAAIAGTILRGGDRVRTAAGGEAVIRFADTSTSRLQGNSDVTVLQSFVASTSTGTLYTLLRQTLGTVVHRVNHGSKFDVATPSATAGALGTEFRINVNPNGTGSLTVIESKVSLSSVKHQEVVETGQTVPLTGGQDTEPGLNPNGFSNPTPTPRPTATPTPCVDDRNQGRGNAGECD